MSKTFSLISAKVDKEGVMEHGILSWEPVKRRKHLVSTLSLTLLYFLMLLIFSEWVVAKVRIWEIADE